MSVTSVQRQQLARRPLIRKVLDLTKGTVVEMRQRELPLEQPVPMTAAESALVEGFEPEDEDE